MKNKLTKILTLVLALVCVTALVACDGIWDKKTNDDLGELFTYELSDDGNYYIVTGINDLSVTSVKIPTVYKDLPVKGIGPNTFNGCHSLKDIEIHSGLLEIDPDAFEGVDTIEFNEYENGFYLGYDGNPYLVLIKAKNFNITEMEIPSNTMFIYYNALKNCKKLETITADMTKAQWKALPKGDDWDKNTRDFIVICTDGEITDEDVHEHSFTYYDSDNNATCTEDGTKTAKCDGCDVTETVDDEGSKLGHSFTDYDSDNNATCTEDGTKTAKCDACDELDTITDEGTIKPHTLVSDVTKEPTCTEVGIKTWSCTGCDYTESDEIFAQHTESEWMVETEPTCTENGIQYKNCTECEAEKIVTAFVPMLGHDFVLAEEKVANCTEDGFVRYACQNEGCNESKEQISYAHGHEFGYDIECDICGYILAIHEHTYTAVVTEPTCQTMGYTTFTCSCGFSRRDNYVEQTNHSWDEGVVTIAKTCSSEGTLVYSCATCDATMTFTIPASHEWVDTVIRPANCKLEGKMGKICSDCGLEDVELISLAHKWGEDVVVKEATCDEEGEISHSCTACGATETYKIDVLGHNFVDGICTVCGADIYDIIVPEDKDFYGMYFKVDDVISNYGPEYVNEYGVMLDYNEDAVIEKVAVYLIQDGTMWHRGIAVVGQNITYATYVPYLSYGDDIKYSGLNSSWINTFALRKNTDDIWCYGNYTTVGVNLEDMYGNLLASLYGIGQAGAQTKIFDDLDEMVKWLNGVDINHVHSYETQTTTASCEVPAYSYDLCECGDIINVEIIAPANGHVSSDWIIEKEVSATENGLRYKQCTICDRVLATEELTLSGLTTNGAYNNNIWSAGGQNTFTDPETGVTYSQYVTAKDYNVYDITYRVQTSTVETQNTASVGAATVLVLDMSGSMSGTGLTQLKTAAKSFLESYAGTDSNQTRYVSIVLYGKDSKVVKDWVNIAGGTTNSKYNEIYNYINALSIGAVVNSGYTNIDAGLYYANQSLSSDIIDGVASKNVITFTDGVINCSGGYGSVSFSSSSSTYNAKTIQTASLVKNNAVLYTIYCNSSTNSTYVNWLKNNIATDTTKAFTANNISQLNVAFKEIQTSIITGMSGNGFIITDTLSGFVTSAGGNTVRIVLDVNDAVVVKNGTLESGLVTTYTYTYTVTVSLDIDNIEDFDENTFYPVSANSGAVMDLANGGASDDLFFSVAGIRLRATSNTYNVTYDANGGEGSIPSDDGAYKPGDAVDVLFDTIPTRDGYVFLGWGENPDQAVPTYAAKTLRTLYIGSADITLYAIWELIPDTTFTVTYTSNNETGSVPVDETLYYYGDTVTVKFDVIPESAGYEFIGWAGTPNATEATYTEDGLTTFQISKDNVVLYAVWKAVDSD